MHRGYGSRSRASHGEVLAHCVSLDPQYELAPSHSSRLLYGQHEMFVRSPTEHVVWSSFVVGRCGIAIQHFCNAWPTDHYVRTRLHPLLARRRLARERIVVAGV